MAYVPSDEHGVVVFVGRFQGLCLRREGLQSEIGVQAVADLDEFCGVRFGNRLKTRINRAVTAWNRILVVLCDCHIGT